MSRFLCLALLASPVSAQTQVYRLSPAAIEDAKAQASLNPETAALLPSPARDAILGSSLDGQPRDNRIHGEAGFFIGTGGARGLFGTALVPLGENGSALLSFETSRLPGASPRRR